MSLDNSAEKQQRRRVSTLGKSDLSLNKSLASMNRSDVEEDEAFFIRTLTNNIRKQTTKQDLRKRRQDFTIDGLIGDDTGRSIDYLGETDQGLMVLTQEFKDELNELGDEEADKLLQAARNPATPDLFGIPRKKCEADPECIGYQAQAVLCPSPKNE